MHSINRQAIWVHQYTKTSIVMTELQMRVLESFVIKLSPQEKMGAFIWVGKVDSLQTTLNIIPSRWDFWSYV